MKNEFLRHTLATINYRFQKSVGEAKDSFDDFNIGKGSRSPKEIINHMYQVLSSTRIYILEKRYHKAIPEKLNLKLEIDRFNLELKNVDNILAERDVGIDYTKRLLQGPFSDILTHIGQIAMLSRLNGNPIKGEDFSSALIKTGLN